MREDEENIRHFMPVLRRMIILVAVLTAIPVAMWTITAFVRTYVGPPKLPTFRPLAATASIDPANAATAPADPATTAKDAKATTPPPVVEARATITDAGAVGPPSAPTGPGSPTDLTPTGAVPQTTSPVALVAAPHPAASAAPSAFAAEQPPSAPWPAAPSSGAPPATSAQNWPGTPPAAVDLPAVTPLAGPVPLPRSRPKAFIMAQARIPLPRPRPETAGPSAAPEAAPASPINFFQNIFRRNSGPAAPAAEETGGAAPATTNFAH